MKNVLFEIQEKVRERLEVQKKEVSVSELELRIKQKGQPPHFLSRFENEKLNIIAEVKYASPSEGEFGIKLTPVEVAKEYLDAGATCLSVLTEPDFFKGSFENLDLINNAFPELPTLMKDFIFDPYQVLKAKSLGASCILLIVAMLEQSQFEELHQLATQLGLQVLTETHDRSELEFAIEKDAKIIGVNNRNLKTLKTDIATSFSMAKEKPEGTTFISESGIVSNEQVIQLKDAGFDGFLVGSSLMKTGTPGLALKKLLGVSA